MPSKAEIEAAAQAILDRTGLDGWDWAVADAEAILTAAERVRWPTPGTMIPEQEARTQPCRTCGGERTVYVPKGKKHQPCPTCQPETGQPLRWKEGEEGKWRAKPGPYTNIYPRRPGTEQQTSDGGAGTGNSPDTGAKGSTCDCPPGGAKPSSEPIPDEAVEAAERVMLSYRALPANPDSEPDTSFEAAFDILTAALPHLEAAIRADELVKAKRFADEIMPEARTQPVEDWRDEWEARTQAETGCCPTCRNARPWGCSECDGERPETGQTYVAEKVRHERL